MTHIITSLCIREGSCVSACPVECIVPGFPQNEWPMYYIDPDSCIDCGACIPVCEFGAIFPEDDVPEAYIAVGGEIQSAPDGTTGFIAQFDGHDFDGNQVRLNFTRTLKPDEEIDLTPDIQQNYKFFSEGPGYASILD